MKTLASKPSKCQHSNTGSRSSRLSERHQLESRAKFLEQESRMTIGKKEKELELKRKQRVKVIEAVLRETGLADLRYQTSLKMHEMKLQIKRSRRLLSWVNCQSDVVIN